MFAYKVMVYAGRKTGWILGSVSAVLGTIYFYLLDMYVYTVLDVGLVVLLAYAFFKKDTVSKDVQTWVRVLTGTVMLIISAAAFNGMLTVVETVSTFGLLIGTVLLTHGRESLGWVLHAMAHLLAAYLGYEKEQAFFADLQIASAIVSILGAIKGKTTWEDPF